MFNLFIINITRSNTWGLENVANSDKLPPRGFLVYNLAHKLSGGSGGPTRVVAVLDQINGAGRPSASAWKQLCWLNLLCNTPVNPQDLYSFSVDPLVFLGFH